MYNARHEVAWKNFTPSSKGHSIGIAAMKAWRIYTSTATLCIFLVPSICRGLDGLSIPGIRFYSIIIVRSMR